MRLEWFTRVAFPVTSAFKAWTLYYLMLPLKVGFAESVRPTYWGFEMSSEVSAWPLAGWLRCSPPRAWGGPGRVAAALLATSISTANRRAAAAVSPWWRALAWLRRRLTGCASFTLARLLFILLARHRGRGAMVSLQLCAVGVLMSFLGGSGLGIWAALSDRVSAFAPPHL